KVRQCRSPETPGRRRDLGGSSPAACSLQFRPAFRMPRCKKSTPILSRATVAGETSDASPYFLLGYCPSPGLPGDMSLAVQTTQADPDLAQAAAARAGASMIVQNRRRAPD